MSSNGCGQIHKGVELLELTGSYNRQQAFDGPLALFAPRAKHDLPPLHRCPERTFGGVVGRRDPLRVHKGEEVLIVHEEREGQVSDVGIGGIEVAFAQREESFLDRQHLVDQLGAGEGRPAGAGIAPKAMPQPKQTAVEREGFTAEACRGRRSSDATA